MADYDDYQRQLDFEREREEREYQYRLDEEERRRQMELDRQEERLREDEASDHERQRTHDESQRALEQERLQEERWASNAQERSGHRGDSYEGDYRSSRRDGSFGRWHRRWLWSRRIREDNARRRRLKDEARYAESDANDTDHLSGSMPRRRTTAFIAPLAIAVVLLLVVGAGYWYFDSGAAGSTSTRYELPGTDAPMANGGVIVLEGTDSDRPEPQAANQPLARATSEVATGIPIDLTSAEDSEPHPNAAETTFGGLQAITDELGNQLVAAEADREKLRQRVVELADDYHAATSRLESRLDRLQQTERGFSEALELQSADLAGLTNKFTELGDDVAALEAPKGGSLPSTVPQTFTKTLSNTLPFQLVAIDFLAGRHFATVENRGQLQRAGTHERIDGWTVATIEPENARVVFERDGELLAQTVGDGSQ